MPWQGKTELTLTGTDHSQPEGVEEEKGKKEKIPNQKDAYFLNRSSQCHIIL